MPPVSQNNLNDQYDFLALYDLLSTRMPYLVYECVRLIEVRWVKVYGRAVISRNDSPAKPELISTDGQWADLEIGP